MKINERTLVAYSTSASSPTDKEGWLFRRGEKGFQRRYLVLKGNLLFYFEKKGDKEPLGMIILEGCTIELAEDEQEKFAFKIVFHGEGKRTYVLGTESQDNLEEWMKILACASYDYMKLMVMELQQQLADLEEIERMSNGASSAAGVASTAANKSVGVKSSEELLSGLDLHDGDNEQVLLSKSLSPVVKTWQTVHSEVGSKILSDRRRWCQVMRTDL